MCGLVGVAGNITQKEETAFKQMLLVDSLRGVDSTGIATIRRHNGEVQVAKKVGHAYDLIDTHSYTKAMQGMFKAIIGHNRWGTVGKNSNKNAHPFEFDNVVGAHNGTLTCKFRFDDHTQFDVDSAAMYNHMDKNGLRNTMTKMEGAWALTWWDQEDHTINFLRNKERPLWMCYSKDGKTLFWASEPWMLHGMLGRNGIDYSNVVSLEEDMHVQIHIDEKGAMDKPIMVAMPSTLPKAVYQVAQTNYTGGKWVGLPEKKSTEVAPPATNSQVSHVKPGYQDSKAVTLEVLNVQTDKFGASYLNLMDRNNKTLNIRWYFHSHKVNSLDYIGEEIIADIKDMKTVPGEGTYYKVDTNTIRSIPPVGVEKEEEGVSDEVFQGGDGKFYSFQDWGKKWGSCNWCDSNIHPHEAHGFDNQQYSYCSSCVNDTEVSQYVNLNIVEASNPF